MFLFLIFATDHRDIFWSCWSRGISKKSRKEICIACSKSVFGFEKKNVGAWYWKSAILSTALRICQHEDIWPITAWYLNLVSRNGGVKGTQGFRAARIARRYFPVLTAYIIGALRNLSYILQIPPCSGSPGRVWCFAVSLLKFRVLPRSLSFCPRSGEGSFCRCKPPSTGTSLWCHGYPSSTFSFLTRL